MSMQLPLNLRLRDSSSFENFVAAGNLEAVDRLLGLLAEPPAVSGPASLFFWGDPASGKSHLLQAACRLVQACAKLALYVPLAEPGMKPAVLEEAEHAFLVCVDDAHHIAGNREWESALFGLYERARATGMRFVAAGSAAPIHLGLQMPELVTRFGWGAVYQLHPLSDTDKLDAVRRRAQHRGIEVPAEVARYILNRYPRDLNSLFALLDRLDDASLARQRRVTIPFIQEIERSLFST